MMSDTEENNTFFDRLKVALILTAMLLVCQHLSQVRQTGEPLIPTFKHDSNPSDVEPHYYPIIFNEN
jgi:hypothetical protein